MTTYYFCDNGTGNDGAVPGDDTLNTGLSSSSPFRSMSKFRTLCNAAAPGDQFLFSKGGAWNAFSARLENRTTTLAAFIANPLVIGVYNPTQFSSTQRPRLNIPAGTSGNPADAAPAFGVLNTSGTTLFGGYDISGFLFDGGTTNEFNMALLVWNCGSYVNFHDNVIQNTAQFVGVQASQPASAIPRNITIRNNTMTDCLGMGIVSWGAENTLIEGNTLTRAANRTGITIGAKAFDHALYVSGDETFTTTRDVYNVTIRNNTCIDSCFGATGAVNNCAGTVIVGHGRIRNWTIENNVVINSTKANDNGWGLAFTAANGVSGQPEYEYQITCRGNRFTNCGNRTIMVDGSNGGIYENNVILQTFTRDGWGIQQRNTGWAEGIANFKNIYRNNSFYFADSDGSNPIVAMDISGVGSGQHQVVNNLVVFAGSGGGKTGFETDIAASGFTAWNNNLVFGANSWCNGASLASWQGSSGLDANSITSNPNLVAAPSIANNASMKVQSGSAAIDTGNATYKSLKAIDGYPVVGTRDIGAFEFGSNP